VLAIALLGFGLRVLGLNFGLPAIYRPDENVSVGRAMGVLHGLVNPHFADWPHLTYYLSAAWLAPLRVVGLVHDQASAHLGVRALNVLLGTLTILVVVDLGRRADSLIAGVLAGAGVAVAFLLVRDSHFGTPDVPLSLAVIGALSITYRVSRAEGLRPLLLSGVAVGVTASVKYNGALVFGAVVAAQWLHGVTERVRAATVLRRVAVIAAIATVTLTVTSPFLVLDPSMTRHGLGYIVSHLASETVPEVGWVRLVIALWYGLDPGLFVLAAIGLACAAVRRDPLDWIILAFVLPYYAIIGAGHSTFFRYADPLVAPLLLLAGRAAAAGLTRLPDLPRRGMAFALLLAVTLLPAVYHDIRYDLLIQQPDTRTLAFNWLAAHVPAGDRVAIPYKPGPAHDQALIDSRAQSVGATDPYVASFLENRLEDRYQVRDLTEDDLQQASVAALRAAGVSFVVIGRRRPDLGCAAPTPLERALQQQARLVASFAPTSTACPPAVFDPIDTYYVPLAGYAGFLRPGPSLRIYRLGE
jgi:hypothetical protein